MVMFIFLYYRGVCMVRKGYTNVSIPNSLIKEIDVLVKKQTLGYTSRAELIKEAIRKLLKDL